MKNLFFSHPFTIKKLYQKLVIMKEKLKKYSIIFLITGIANSKPLTDKLKKI